MTKTLFAPAKLGPFALHNHIVLSPMTRSRAAAADGVPSELQAEFYEQRASAGLLITEGTAPAANGRGYARIPGLWSEAQVAGWKKVTERVHAKGGVIFAQLMHTGRVSHPLNFPGGHGEVVAPSAVQLTEGQMWTDEKQMQGYPTPHALSGEEIAHILDEHVTAARNAVAAGFDGIELHGANGYLSEQFLNPHTNQRSDEWGGSVEKRTRFLLSALQKMAAAIGKERVGVRFSPYGVNAGMKPYEEIDATYTRLADEVSGLGIAYVHVVDHSAMGAPHVPDSIKATIRSHFSGTYIAAGGFDAASAQKALDEKRADLVAFGRPFIANPDLVARLEHGWPLAAPNFDLFYTPGPHGYTDYSPHQS